MILHINEKVSWLFYQSRSKCEELLRTPDHWIQEHFYLYIFYLSSAIQIFSSNSDASLILIFGGHVFDWRYFIISFILKVGSFPYWSSYGTNPVLWCVVMFRMFSTLSTWLIQAVCFLQQNARNFLPNSLITLSVGLDCGCRIDEYIILMSSPFIFSFHIFDVNCVPWSLKIDWGLPTFGM